MKSSKVSSVADNRKVQEIDPEGRETEEYGSWIPQGPKPRMGVLAKTSSNLPDPGTGVLRYTLVLNV
jgi:hypothetical protein